MAETTGKANMDTPVGVKYDDNKPKLTYGAKKYSPDNWMHLDNARQRYFDAANRHLWQWFGGEERDEESGFHHLAHAMSSLMFIIQMDINKEKEMDSWKATEMPSLFTTPSEPHGW
jgi:hypothetical protein